MAFILLQIAAPMLSAEPDRAIDVGSRKQFFIDHKFIEASEGVSLAMNPPTRTGEIILSADAPWEKGLRIGSYCTLASENGRIRLWYSVEGQEHERGQNPEFMGVAYAESTDGIHFSKPLLNLVTFAGSKANNLVLPTDPAVASVGGGTVMRDDNPRCDPQERYKSWMKIYPKKGTGIKGPSRVWASPDGLHWHLTEQPVTGLRAVDTQASWFWDPRVGRYVGYSREWIRFAGENPLRGFSYNESDDMHAWTKTGVVLAPDEGDAAFTVRPLTDPDHIALDKNIWVSGAKAQKRWANSDHSEIPGDIVPIPGTPADIYGPGVFRYGDIYLSLMTMFYHWNYSPEGTTPDTSDVRLGASRDGRHFMRVGGRKPFLSTGPSGAFDSKWIWPLLAPIAMGDELWLYYFGMNEDHGSRLDPLAKARATIISRAVMRRDGFVSADFDYTGGTILTPPLHFVGRQLELNLDAGAGGMGRVEILDEGGAPLAGFTLLDADQLIGNRVDMPVSWHGKTDLSSLAGKTVRLRLVMRGAKLYAFRFR